MAVADVKWFDSNVYMGNKLATMPAGTTMDSLVALMEKAGYSGPEGYLRHFLDWGHTEDVSPSAGFDAQQYYTFKAARDYYSGDVSKVTAADVNKMKTAIDAAGMDAWTHYQKYGTSEMVNASNSFDTAAYLQAKSAAMGGALTAEGVALAIQNAGMNAYEHYMQYKGGAGEVAFDQTFVVASSKQISTAFTLTVNPDVATANVFDAPRGWTPGGTDQMNTLNDDDVLTGTGDNPTLNMNFVDVGDAGDAVTITPELRGIETINVNVLGTANKTLDLQDATGAEAVNVSRINNTNFTTQNIADALSTMSVNNTQATANNVSFTFLNTALAGDADTAALALNNAAVGTLRVEGVGATPTVGYETLNLSSVGADNTVALLQAEDLQTLNVSGDQDLTLGSSSNITGPGGRVEGTLFTAGLANVAGSLDTIDASAMTGDIQIHLGGEVTATRDGTSGVAIDFTYTGSQGDDDVVLTGGMDADDTLDGGEGENKLVVTATANSGNISNFQLLGVVGQGAGVTNITVDTAIMDGLESVQIRNEGQAGGASTAQTLTTTLDNVSAEVAQNITLLHGNSTNNGLAANVVNVNTVTAATSVGIAIEDGVNTDARFNATLNTSNNVDNVSIADADTESNTVRLVNVANLDGSVTLTGGAAGQFMNLDATGNLFGYDTTGGNTDNGYVTDVGAGAAERLEAATIDAAAYAGNVVVRVSDADSVTGAQTITMGAGNDTVIFDDLNDNTAGLTISDTVNGGEGNDTLAIDGNGVNINISASEWTNVSNFETIRLVGNGQADNNAQNAVNAYNLTLTNDLIAANGSAVTGGRSIAIVNDNGANAAASANAGVTIDARTLNAQSSFSYDGQETDAAVGTTMTADRFIMADANINGLAVIDGGADVTGGATPGYSANADVLEVRNAAVVTIGDLAGVSNVGTIEFTNDTAVVQTSNLVLDSATVDRLVNTTNNATLTNTETLTVRAFDNALVFGAHTALNLDARQVGGQFALNIDTSGTANAGDDTVQSAINVGGATQVIDLGGETLLGGDTVSFTGTAGAVALGTTAATAVTFSTGASTQVFDLTDVEILDFSAVTLNGAGGNTITTAATTGDGSVTTLTVANATAGWTIDDQAAGTQLTTIIGGAGNDTLLAGTAVTTLSGGAGNDTLDASAAAAGVNIIGGAGVDAMTAATAGGMFTFSAGDTGLALGSIDTIALFVSGMDKLAFGGPLGAAGNFSDAGAVADFATALAAANTAMDGTIQYVFADDSTDGWVFFDRNADGTADEAVQLTGVTAVAATDIII